MCILDNKYRCQLIKTTIMLLLMVFISVSSPFSFSQEEGEVIEDITEQERHTKPIKGGWYTFEPFQYQIEKNGIKKLTGLDYELMRVISREVGQPLDYIHMPWDELKKEIQDGKMDFAMDVLYTKERAEYAYYSIPYRYTEASLFVPRGKIAGLHHKTVEELLDYMKKNKFKLGVVHGFVYASQQLNEYIKDPQNESFVVKSQSDHQNLDLLLNGEIDGFIADRIVGSTILWHVQSSKPIVEYRLNMVAPVHILFSKKTIPYTLVEKYNEAIKRINGTETYANIISWYLYPTVVLQIQNAAWFKIIEIIGVVAFAISGLIIAFREKTTLFGAVILAILPSLGGGLMRDVIFGRNPVGALRSPIYLSSVLITVVVGFIIVKLLTHYRKHYKIPGEIEDLIPHYGRVILTVTDAIGLATFTVIGVMVSLLSRATPLWLWGPFFAFLTGAGGGILRDMLSKSRYIEALEGELYGELAIIWGLFLSLYILLSVNQAAPEQIEYAVIITIAGVFFSRLYVHFAHIPNLRFKRETERR